MTNKKDSLKKTIQEENEFWTKIFKKEDKNFVNEFSSHWWKLYYQEISGYIRSFFDFNGDFNLLEAGSGSGKASILLGKNVRRTFLDISPSALQFAKKLSTRFGTSNIDYVEGDIFIMPFENNQFTLTWNIGVVEHYSKKEIKEILREMIRVTKNDGYVIIGFPNFKSFPIIKAKLLKKNIFKYISGYRLGSEINYSLEEIQALAKSVSSNEINLKLIDSTTLGNPLIMETPKIIIKLLGRFFEKIFYDRKFLHMLVFNVNKIG